jgi:hypothetical protein
MPYTRELLAAVPRPGEPREITGEPLLRLTDVHKHFPPPRRRSLRRTEPVKAVDGVTLEVRRGETLGVAAATQTKTNVTLGTWLDIRFTTIGDSPLLATSITDPDAEIRIDGIGAAGIALAAYAVCVWPANFKHAIDGVDLPYIASSWLYHGPRLAFQPVLVWWALYASEAIDWPWRR